MANETSSAILGELESLTKDPKATDDYTKETDGLIPKAQELAMAGRLQEAIDEILVLEKKTRQACDAVNCSKLTCLILKLLKASGDLTQCREYIVLLTKKRGQLKRCVVDMVQLCMSWLDDFTEKKQKLDLIGTLSAVTEGKIFVEVERARLTQRLANIKEEEGNIDEAAQLLQEVQVETFGAMEKREKVSYILHQMRVVLLRKDFVRCQIINRKLNVKLLEGDDYQALKCQFYEYMIEYYLHENQLLDVCKAYYAIFQTRDIQNDINQWKKVLSAYTVYLLLAPFDNEQNDLLVKLWKLEKKKLSEVPIFLNLVCAFLKVELMPWPLPYEKELKSHACFTDESHSGGAGRWTILKKRVMQHNLQVLGTYYNRIKITRISSLLGLSIEECEVEISELVYSKLLKAKIDRPAGTVTFGDRKDACDHLNSWSGNISNLLELVDESSHLIQKERMVFAARAKKAQMLARNMPGVGAVSVEAA